MKNESKQLESVNTNEMDLLMSIDFNDRKYLELCDKTDAASSYSDCAGPTDCPTSDCGVS